MKNGNVEGGGTQDDKGGSKLMGNQAGGDLRGCEKDAEYSQIYPVSMAKPQADADFVTCYEDREKKREYFL